MVTPSALIAATPVGATTVICLSVSVFRRRKKVVLPVPALPVRKIQRLVCCTYSYASSYAFMSLFVVIITIEERETLVEQFVLIFANT